MIRSWENPSRSLGTLASSSSIRSMLVLYSSLCVENAPFFVSGEVVCFWDPKEANIADDIEACIEGRLEGKKIASAEDAEEKKSSMSPEEVLTHVF